MAAVPHVSAKCHMDAHERSWQFNGSATALPWDCHGGTICHGAAMTDSVAWQCHSRQCHELPRRKFSCRAILHCLPWNYHEHTRTRYMPWCCHENVMEPHGLSWHCHGPSWQLMESHGILWNLMEPHGILIVFTVPHGSSMAGSTTMAVPRCSPKLQSQVAVPWQPP